MATGGKEEEAEVEKSTKDKLRRSTKTIAAANIKEEGEKR